MGLLIFTISTKLTIYIYLFKLINVWFFTLHTGKLLFPKDSKTDFTGANKKKIGHRLNYS